MCVVSLFEFQAKHIGMLASFQRDCDRLDSQKKVNKLDEDDIADPSAKPGPSQKKQCTISQFKPLTQSSADGYILDYIVDSVLPIHHVDTPAFENLVRKLTCGHIAPRCRQTVTAQLEERFQQRKADLRNHLQKVGTVCTTADCWTSRRRSFIGVTVHWIDVETLERRGACLAVKQITGSHTYDVIAKELEHINEEFCLTDKICFTVTDSGSNFIKAFKHFGLEEAEEFADEAEEAEDDIEFHQLDDALSPQGTEIMDEHEEQTIYKLPPHWKCSCHALNLVATTDASKFDGASAASLKRVSVQTFAKLTAIWNKQNRSTQAAEKIRDALGTLLPTPGDTRWNSMFDAVSKIHSLLSKPQLDNSFDKLCDELTIKRLQPLQKTFIAEYVQVILKKIK